MRIAMAIAGVLCLLLTALVVRLGAQASVQPDRRAVDQRQEIAAASRAFSQAYVSGDTATIRDLYTSDAILLPPEGDVRGRDAIARYFAPRARRTNLAHAMTSDDLHVSDSLAIDVGTWSNAWRIDDGPVREASGRYLVVWRRGEDRRWRIAYDMWHRPVNR